MKVAEAIGITRAIHLPQLRCGCLRPGRQEYERPGLWPGLLCLGARVALGSAGCAGALFPSF